MPSVRFHKTQNAQLKQTNYRLGNAFFLIFHASDWSEAFRGQKCVGTSDSLRSNEMSVKLPPSWALSTS